MFEQAFSPTRTCYFEVQVDVCLKCKLLKRETPVGEFALVELVSEIVAPQLIARVTRKLFWSIFKLTRTTPATRPQDELVYPFVFPELAKVCQLSSDGLT